ncbi:MAG: hypothetical protein ACK5A0_13965 [Polaromonas sp.]|jgi:hypothetical protein
MPSSKALKTRKEGVLLKSAQRRDGPKQPIPLCDAGAPAPADMNTLDAKLEAFDPKRHGGEAMATARVGTEIF